MNYAWRLIDTGSCSAAYNMALDEAIAITVRQDLSPPTLRIYGWNQPSLSIGCFQKSGDAVQNQDGDIFDRGEGFIVGQEKL